MNRNLISCAVRQILWKTVVVLAPLPAVLQAQTNPPAPNRPVTQAASSMTRNATVYSIRFPGGTARTFFEFLRTNGFADDTVLFAGQAASVQVPDFTVRKVRLRDVAKALELVTEDKLRVELQEAGEESDVNVWRIKMAEGAGAIKSRACPMPSLFARQKPADRIRAIADAAEETLERELLAAGRSSGIKGTIRTLESERIVLVVGSDAYVEAVSSALEAAERVLTTRGDL